MVPDASKLYEVGEFGVAQNFARDGVFARVLDDALRLTGRVRLNGDNTWWEACLELFLVFLWDRRADVDAWKEAVRSGGCSIGQEKSYREADRTHRPVRTWRGLLRRL